MKKKLNLIDCTLRDGGYYNNWFFDKSLVNDYLQSMKKAKVDYVELGFRFADKNKMLGPYAFTTDAFIKTLKTFKSQKYAVMINGSEYLKNTKKLIDENFNHRNSSLITLVRIAININDALKCQNLINLLKNKGYKVALNLMQPQNKDKNFLIQISQEIKSWGNLDILYFADSLGCLSNSHIKDICIIFNKNWLGKFGIHAHNNRQMALSNTIEAIDNEVMWCDSTVLGMGRGAGNLNTEIALSEFAYLKMHNGNSLHLTNILEKFKTLKEIYDWGPSVYYHFAANNLIHPSYIQNILSDKRYNSQQINEILLNLAKINSENFNSNLIIKNKTLKQTNSKGTWDPQGYFKKNIVLIANSKITQKHIEDINIFIKKKEFDNVAINNIPKNLSFKEIKCLITSNHLRIFLDFNIKNFKKIPIITPKKNFTENTIIKNKHLILDYGIKYSKKNTTTPMKYCCEVQTELTIEYALSVFARSKVKNIYLIGFEGYEDKILNDKINKIFNYFSSKFKINFISLTRTNYEIQQKSIYSIL